MRSLGRSMSLAAFVLALACVVSSIPVAALDRVDGQFWTYDISTPLLGVNASGTISYHLSGQDTVMIDGSSYDSDVYTISGNLTASSALFGVPYTVTATERGTRYDTKGQVSVLREVLDRWTNVSLESVPPALLARISEETNTTYVNAYMSGFDPAAVRLGDSWEQQTSIRVTTVKNGTLTASTAELATFEFVVASATESVAVPAGEFDTLKITATDDHGGRTVYWWSSNAQAFVLEKHYDPFASEPDTILSLRSYDLKSGEGLLIPIVVGAALLAVAVVILGLLVNARRPKGPVDQGQIEGGIVGTPQLRPRERNLTEEPGEQPKRMKSGGTGNGEAEEEHIGD